jgi:hypothetical protein
VIVQSLKDQGSLCGKSVLPPWKKGTQQRELPGSISLISQKMAILPGLLFLATQWARRNIFCQVGVKKQQALLVQKNSPGQTCCPGLLEGLRKSRLFPLVCHHNPQFVAGALAVFRKRGGSDQQLWQMPDEAKGRAFMGTTLSQERFIQYKGGLFLFCPPGCQVKCQHLVGRTIDHIPKQRRDDLPLLLCASSNGAIEHELTQPPGMGSPFKAHGQDLAPSQLK